MFNFLALLGWSPGNDDRSCSRATSWCRRSRSRGSAAATRCSTPRSSTGSTSSTSRGSRPDELAVRRQAVARSGRSVARRVSSATGTRGSSRSSSCCGRARSGSTTSPTQGALFFSDAIEYDAAAVEKHLRAPGVDGAPRGDRRRARRARDVRCGVDRGGAARARRGARREGGRAHPRGARRGQRKDGQPRTVRGPLAARPGAACTRAWLRRKLLFN